MIVVAFVIKRMAEIDNTDYFVLDLDRDRKHGGDADIVIHFQVLIIRRNIGDKYRPFCYKGGSSNSDTGL